MGQHSPFAEDDKPLRHEAQYLIAQLRWPATSDEEAIRLTLENYPGLTEDEIRSWWRAGEFRTGVREARAVAAEYAAEGVDAGRTEFGRTPPPRGVADPFAVPTAEAFSSPAAPQSSWLSRWRWRG